MLGALYSQASEGPPRITKTQTRVVTRPCGGFVLAIARVKKLAAGQDCRWRRSTLAARAGPERGLRSGLFHSGGYSLSAAGPPHWWPLGNFVAHRQRGRRLGCWFAQAAESGSELRAPLRSHPCAIPS